MILHVRMIVLSFIFGIGPASGLRLVSPNNHATSNFARTELGSGDALVLDAPPTKLVILAEINTQYIESGLFQNWLYHATPYLNDTVSFIFDCADKQTQSELLKFKLPVDAYVIDDNFKFAKLDQSAPDLYKAKNDPYHYGTQKYKDLMIKRPKAVHALLEKQISVLVIDLDTVWVKDPFLQVQKAGQRSLLVTSDGFKRGSEQKCGCFLFFRSGPGALEIASEWTKKTMEMDAAGNQHALNAILEHVDGRGWDVGMLPMDQFPPGNKANDHTHATVYHANWRIGTDKKVLWLKNHNLWHEPTDMAARSLATQNLEEIFKEADDTK